MNNLIWGKTILSLSSKLPLAIKNLDNSIDAYITATFQRRRDAYLEIDGLRRLILKKKNLQLINLIHDEVTAKMNTNQVKILKYRYYFNIGFKNIADKMELSIRTTFRRYDAAVELFCELLLRLGYDTVALESYFCDEPYIMQEYKYQQKLQERANATAEAKVVYILPSSNKGESEVLVSKPKAENSPYFIN